MASKQNIDNVENVVGVDETLHLNEEESSGSEVDKNKDQSRQRAGSIEDDMELRWDDDDVDDISVTNEDALLEDVTMETDDNVKPTESKKVLDVIRKRHIDEVSLNKYIDEINVDNTFEPAKPHGLNKPDMMLEILTQELSDLSDDEDLTNLKMSPDLEVEACDIDKGNEKNLTMQTDFLFDEKSNDSLLSENIVSDSEKHINNVLSKEGNLAADLLRKELAMDLDDSSTAVTLEDEDLLLRDDIENEQVDAPIVEIDLNEEEINLDTQKAPEIQSKEEMLKKNEKENLLVTLPNPEIKVDLTLDKDVIDITSIEEAKCLEMDIERETSEMSDVIESAYLKIKKYPKLDNMDSDKLNSLQIGKKSELPKEVTKKADIDKLQIQELSSTPVHHLKKKLSLKFKKTSQAASNTLELDKDSIKDSLLFEPQQTDNFENLDIDPQPSTSGLETNEINYNKESLQIPKDIEPQPSTSNHNVSLFSSATQDVEDVPEPSDSLGLLSESSRIMRHEEVEDEGLDEEEGDDSEHFDDSSNQMIAEYSEDSNHHQSDDPNDSTNATPTIEKDFNFTITGVTTETAVDKMESDEKEKNKTDIKSQTKLSKIQEKKEKNTNNREDAQESMKIEAKTENIETAVTESIHENNTVREGLVSETTETDAVETKTAETISVKQTKTKSQGLEVFNLDSDDEEIHEKHNDQSDNSKDQISAPVKCINKSCNRNNSDYNRADSTTVNYNGPERKRRGMPKTDAERSREYRRRKNESKIKKIKKTAKSSTDRVREYRARRKKLLHKQNKNNSSNMNNNVPGVPINDFEGQSDVPTGNNSINNANAQESLKIESKTESTETAVTENIHENNIVREDLVSETTETDAVEPKIAETISEKQTKPKIQGLEVFNLDSDDEETHEKHNDQSVPPDNAKNQISAPVKCINKSCSRNNSDYYRADNTTINYYDPERKKRGFVCQSCLDVVEKRNQFLISGIRDLVPLLELDPGRPTDELVEISDSESEDEVEPRDPDERTLGEKGARFLEEKLCAIMNATWQRFELDDRLTHAQGELQEELKALQKESVEINQMLEECQVTTDKLRTELYATFECDIKELPAVVIYDVPNCSYTCVDPSGTGSRLLKRKKSSSSDTPTKRSAIPLGYTPLADQNIKTTEFKNEKTEDENQEVSVVHLSVEAAPPDLPPAGEMSYSPLKVGMTVYASKNVYGSWMKAKIVEITPKTASMPFTMCRVKFEYKLSKPTKILPARCLAYSEPPDVRMTIGTRVIALFKDINMRESFYSGIVAEIPNPVNKYRYLIFFDDGYAQYAPHPWVRAVCERSALVWEEVQPKSRDFVRKYLLAYPERPMVRLHPGQSLKTEWRGNWWSSVVMSVDASLVEVQFTNRERREWIYRGSTRLAPLYLELQAAERHRPRALPRTQPHSRTNMPYVEYTRSDEQTNKQTDSNQQQQQTEEVRRQRAVAKKSTTEARPPPPSGGQNLDNVTSRVVYYTPKKQVKPLKMVPHTCSPKCKRPDVLALKDLRTYNPLAKPLLSGWERQIVRYKGSKAVSYVSPCGRRLRGAAELHRYLRAVGHDLPVDLFDFAPSTHCLAEFVLNKCYVGKKDLSHGKENVPVPCVNYYDESLPEFCSYNTERTPTAGVPLNLDPEFLCGCDCEDDCEDKTKCACWKLTLEGARTIGLEGDVGYVYKRLPEPLPSGIYECNSRCKCKDTCLNRVAQHPLQLKLQVFKTLNRGWGIRALNDIPRGAFVCVYAGNLLTDATANLDGLNEGDEYLAELDYIEVVEQMKEGYEEDIPEKIKKLDQAELAKRQLIPDDEPESSSSEDEGYNVNGEEDDDFRPGYIGLGVTEFNKRLRRRDSKVDKDIPVKKVNEKDKPEVRKENDEECITISDDEEVREPSCFTAAAGMGANEFKSKYRSVRTLFGEDEACYIMDAKVQGNIGRYLNHSCVPNVFVQNVFVDTHDPRFPWVAFFALRAVRAGGELTWNYNYDVGSVPGKVLYCYCGAPTCRGRLL